MLKTVCESVLPPLIVSWARFSELGNEAFDGWTLWPDTTVARRSAVKSETMVLATVDIAMAG